MSLRTITLSVAVMVALIGSYIVFFDPMNQSSASESKRLTFLMAHKPDNADNVALIQAFADRVYDRTNGAITIEPIDPNYDNEAYDNPRTRYTLGLAEVDKGDVAISQAYVGVFPDLYPDLFPLLALNGPFVFKNHAHSARVLDGNVGDSLRELVGAGSNGRLHALFFTYSGGYRSIFTTVPVSTLGDLKGLGMASIGKLSSEFMRDLGLDVHDDIALRSSAWEAGIMGGDIRAEEAELIRIESHRTRYPEVFNKINTIIETEHNLYLTLLVMNGAIFDSLTVEQQNIITEEAHRLALEERELSIRQADEARAGFLRDGISIIVPTESEKRSLESVAQMVRAQYTDTLGDWFARIAAEE